MKEIPFEMNYTSRFTSLPRSRLLHDLGENFASITKMECMAKWMEEQRLNGLSERLNSE